MMLSCHLFQSFLKKALLYYPYLVKKNVNSVKTKLYYAPKKSIRCPFFQCLTKKSLLSCPYLVKKTKNFWKTRCSHAHVLSKIRPFSQKYSAPMSFFSNFHGKSLPVMPIFGQKNVNSVKTTLYYRPKSQ